MATQRYSIDINAIKGIQSKLAKDCTDNTPTTEEATKQWFIMPLVQALGYSIYNTDVIPEYTLDVGIKNGEKVDYMVQVDNKPVMIIECKKFGTQLSSKYVSQLYRYFSVSDVRVAILTNGDDYWFYTDSVKENIMDLEPYLHIQISSKNPNIYDELNRYSKINMKNKDIREDLGLKPTQYKDSTINVDEQYCDTKEKVNNSSRNFFITDEYLKNVLNRVDKRQEDNAQSIGELTKLYKNFKLDVKVLMYGLRTNNPPDWLFYELLERNGCTDLKNKEILASHLRLEIDQLIRQPLTKEEVAERTAINVTNRMNLGKSLNDYSMIQDGKLKIYEEHDASDFEVFIPPELDLEEDGIEELQTETQAQSSKHTQLDEFEFEINKLRETLLGNSNNNKDGDDSQQSNNKKEKINKMKEALKATIIEPSKSKSNKSTTSKNKEKASNIKLNHEYIFNDYSDGNWRFHKIGYAIIFGTKYDNISGRGLLLTTFETLLDSGVIDPENIVENKEFMGGYKIGVGKHEDTLRTHYIEKYNIYIRTSYNMDGIVRFVERILDYAKIPYEEIRLSFVS